jgi:hypothetical protein
MKVVLSGALLRFADYAKEVDIPAPTFAECVNQLTVKYPQLKPVLLDGDGGVRLTHQLFLNGEQLTREQRALDAAPVPVADSDTLFILTAVAGG